MNDIALIGQRADRGRGPRRHRRLIEFGKESTLPWYSHQRALAARRQPCQQHTQADFTATQDESVVGDQARTPRVTEVRRGHAARCVEAGADPRARRSW